MHYVLRLAVHISLMEVEHVINTTSHIRRVTTPVELLKLVWTFIFRAELAPMISLAHHLTLPPLPPQLVVRLCQRLRLAIPKFRKRVSIWDFW
jgi:hypothetical protein